MPVRSLGKQVGRGLDAAELPADRTSERAGERRLADARHALEQQVAVGEQADGRGLHGLGVAGDHELDVVDEAAEGIARRPPSPNGAGEGSIMHGSFDPAAERA